MKEQILSKMDEIVNSVVDYCKSDYTEYDRPYIANEAKFPLIWAVNDCGTRLLKLGKYADDFAQYEQLRWLYANGKQHRYSYELENIGTPNYNGEFYLITEDEIRQITSSQAKEVIRDVITPVHESWKDDIPEYRRPDIKLCGITLSELKGLVQDCIDHGDDSLMRMLKSFRRYQRISHDHEVRVRFCNPKEFNFAEYINGKCYLSGGIIFHGWPESGYETNGSVQLTPSYGWQIHT